MHTQIIVAQKMDIKSSDVRGTPPIITPLDGYKVIQLTNLISPNIGDIIDKKELAALVRMDVDIIIK